MTMVRTFIGMGSNLGNRRANILSAWKTLTDKCSTRIEVISSPYLSEPVEIDSENWFINAVGIMDTDLHPAGLLTEMLAIETAMGRDRTRSEDRIIDLDLLYYGDLVLEEEN
ncbi:MAG: 2-amino-4-hydroxy-6-hydroxymethyldihydropteridine diphosphokinase, partial [Desulfobia sp.]